MTKANQYVLAHWDNYKVDGKQVFKSESDCYDFLVVCEAYNTSLEIAYESSNSWYDDLGYVCWGEENTLLDCVKTARMDTTVYRNTTVSEVALSRATVTYNDDKIFYDENGETIESLKNDYISGNMDNDLIQVGNDVVFRIYC